MLRDNRQCYFSLWIFVVPTSKHQAQASPPSNDPNTFCPCCLPCPSCRSGSYQPRCLGRAQSICTAQEGCSLPSRTSARSHEGWQGSRTSFSWSFGAEPNSTPEHVHTPSRREGKLRLSLSILLSGFGANLFLQAGYANIRRVTQQPSWHTNEHRRFTNSTANQSSSRAVNSCSKMYQDSVAHRAQRRRQITASMPPAKPNHW